MLIHRCVCSKVHFKPSLEGLPHDGGEPSLWARLRARLKIQYGHCSVSLTIRGVLINVFLEKAWEAGLNVDRMRWRLAIACSSNQASIFTISTYLFKLLM